MRNARRLFAFLPLVALVALVGLFWLRMEGGLTQDSRDPMAGRQMPAIDGLTMPLGEAYILNIFASWCAPCAIEHPVLKQYAGHPGALPVYGIAYKDKPADIARYLAQHGNIYEAHVRDDDGRLGIELGVGGVPESFLVDENGVIVKRFSGPFTSLEMLHAWLKK